MSGEERGGFGTDISSQRTDDLDRMALERVGNDPLFRTLDLCCGNGSMFLEFIKRGALATAIDLFYPSAINPGSLTDARRFEIIVGDMRDPGMIPKFAPFDLVLWQRALHYFPYEEAVSLLRRVREWMVPGGTLCVSASGFGSELGVDYPGADQILENRFSPLSPEMREKHRIEKPVCLYTEEDLQRILVETGFEIETIFRSPFGNIKGVARA